MGVYVVLHKMPPSKMYNDFTEGEAIMQKGKNPPYETALYIPITCPHCKVIFTEIKLGDIKTTKASKCLKHLRICKEYKGEVIPAPEKKHKDPMIASLMERMGGLESIVASQGETIASQGKTIASHEAMVDVLVNDYGMFRPITDQNIRPQITMLLDQSTSSSTAIVTASDAAQMQQHQLLLVQKDSVISEQNLLLAQKDKELELAKADLKRIETEFQDKFQRQDATVKRVQEERDAMESKFRAQLKRQRSGASKSLLSQAQQAQKVHVMKHDLLPKGAGGSSRSD